MITYGFIRLGICELQGFEWLTRPVFREGFIENMDGRFIFTIFTPTFNRAHTLGRVYESLKLQEFSDFEWLIIDDGSFDSTFEMVEAWKAESAFPIRYFYQENSGKFSAIRSAVQKAEGIFFLTYDSDDFCSPSALFVLYDAWMSIPEDLRGGFSAVTALCQNSRGEIIGDQYPEDVFDSTPQELMFKYDIKGDKWGFQRLDILKSFDFSVYSDMEYVPEGLVWNSIGKNYKTRYINVKIMTVEYQENGVSNAPRRENSVGLASLNESFLNCETEWFFYSPARFFKASVNYSRFSLLSGVMPIEQFVRVRGLFPRLLWLMFFPIGVAIYSFDLLRFFRLKR